MNAWVIMHFEGTNRPLCHRETPTKPYIVLMTTLGGAATSASENYSTKPSCGVVCLVII